MSKGSILVTDHASIPTRERRLAELLGFRVTTEIPTTVNPEIFGLIVWHHPVDEKLLNLLPNLRIVQRDGVGTDNVDRNLLVSRRVVFANNPDYGVNEVADHTLALLIGGLRGVFASSRSLVVKGEQVWQAPPAGVIGLERVTVGILGLGRIGTAVAKRCHQLGMQVGFYDPYVKSSTERTLPIRRFSNIRELCSASTGLSIHATLSAETTQLIGEPEISLLGPAGFLVNTARGPIVSLEALGFGLRSKNLNFAAIDVTPEEPFGPESSKWHTVRPFVEDGSLIITPHVAYYSEDSFRRMTTFAIKNVIRALSGGKPSNLVLSQRR